MLLSIIIPLKNEEQSILTLIGNITGELKGIAYEIICVSDSTDGTDDIVQHRTDKRIRLIKGKDDLAQSVAKGISLAKGTYLCVMDGDGSHPPRHIKNLLRHAQDTAGLAVGTRIRDHAYISSLSFSRRMLSAIGSLLARPVFSIDDNMSGFFCIKTKHIKDIKFKHRGYKILLEIVARSPGLRITLCPYHFRIREGGKSKIGFKVVMRYLMSIPALYVATARNHLHSSGSSRKSR